jgi:hypothetical protein
MPQSTQARLGEISGSPQSGQTSGAADTGWTGIGWLLAAASKEVKTNEPAESIVRLPIDTHRSNLKTDG